MNRASAESLGWTFEIEGEEGVARKPGPVTLDADKVLERAPGIEFQVTSGIPLFAMLREVAQIEGKPLDGKVTPELVAAISGETYTPPAPVPEVEAAPTLQERVAAALEELAQAPRGTPVTTDQLGTVVQALLGQEGG